MEDTGIGKYITSFGLSAAITSVFSALLVVLKETNEGTVLAWMKAVTIHHWVTHTVLVLILFVALGWIFARANGGQGIKLAPGRLIFVLVSAVAVSGLIISGFYLIEG